MKTPSDYLLSDYINYFYTQYYDMTKNLIQLNILWNYFVIIEMCE
jgi:hypothetical protein